MACICAACGEFCADDCCLNASMSLRASSGPRCRTASDASFSHMISRFYSPRCYPALHFGHDHLQYRQCVSIETGHAPSVLRFGSSLKEKAGQEYCAQKNSRGHLAPRLTTSDRQLKT